MIIRPGVTQVGTYVHVYYVHQISHKPNAILECTILEHVTGTPCTPSASVANLLANYKRDLLKLKVIPHSIDLILQWHSHIPTDSHRIHMQYHHPCMPLDAVHLQLLFKFLPLGAFWCHAVFFFVVFVLYFFPICGEDSSAGCLHALVHRSAAVVPALCKNLLKP